MSYSSTISPTSSSRQSSSVISPAMPPYSSATIARWNLPACISRISRATGLFSGMNRTGRTRSVGRLVAATFPLGADEVLGVEQPDDVLAVGAVQRQPAVAVGDRQVEGGADRGVVGHDDHVRPRHHHLAGHRVAELDDALDELALLVFDDLVLGRLGDDPEQLALGHERSALDALAGKDPVGQADQALGDHAQRPEPHQPGCRPRRHQCGLLAVQHGPRLRDRLGEHEQHDDVEHETEDRTPRAEQAGEQERAERRRRRLQDVDREQDGVEELLRLLDEALQRPPAPRVLVGECLGLVMADPVDARLGDAQQGEQCEQHQQRRRGSARHWW